MSARGGLLCATFLLLTAQLGLAQQRSISGRVLDSQTQQPVSNPSVTVPGTELGAFGTEDGSFVLRGAPADDVTLRVQRIGYRTAEVTVPSDQSTVTVEMRADLLQLEQLVVTGRATALERASVANAIGTVNASELEQVPAASFEQAVQGKVVGADIQKNSGAPGGGISVDLRGVSSINASSTPLYVVDGVIVSNAAIPNNQDVVTLSTGGSNKSPLQQDQVNRIADINPNDIETIEILKGASASAIYGSKASNGVVIITTKRGQPGTPRVDITQRFGVSDLRKTIDYRSFENETLEDAIAVFASRSCREDGLCSAADSANVILPFLAGNFFDHEEELFGRNKLSFETTASVSGGSENTSYFISGIVKNDEGIVNNTGFQRQGLRVNVDQEFGGGWRLSASTNLLRTEARRGLFNNDNINVSPYFALPFIPRFYNLRPDAAGTFPDNPFSGGTNPLQTFELMKNEEEVWRFIGAADLEWEAVRNENSNLRFLARGGVDWFSQENDLFFPPELFFEPDDGLPGTSLLTNANNRNLNVSGDVVYGYTPSSGFVTATTSAGVQYEERDLSLARIVSRNLTAGQENVGAGTQIQVAERREKVEDFGFYLQEELQLLDRRLTLTGAVRGEQSSANGDDEKVFWYPKGSVAYRFADLGAGIEDLKLRAAYGESGNQPLFGQKFTTLDPTQSIEGNAGLGLRPTVGNPEIEPERTREVEGGFDVTLFDGNASFEVTAYQQNITNLILEQTLAPSTGFAARFVNGGDLRVRGIELALGLTPLRTSEFQWVSRTTFALDRSKVFNLRRALGVRQFTPSFTSPNSVFGPSLGEPRIEEGESATQIVGLIPRDPDDPLVASCPPEPAPCILKIGEFNPDFTMSFVNDLRYRGLSLYTLLDWHKGGNIINLDAFIADLAQTTPDFTEIDPATGEPKGAGRLGRFGIDGRAYLEPATYVKLREVTLAYELPSSLIQKWWSSFRRVRLSLSARDLFTWTAFSGPDPEVSNFGNQSITRNVSTSPYPPSRSFWFTIDLGF